HLNYRHGDTGSFLFPFKEGFRNFAKRSHGGVEEYRLAYNFLPCQILVYGVCGFSSCGISPYCYISV
ncbi:MAG: hypothetical protein J6W33_02805, partial [Spirochaetia bacterium]|nr:hypothetical protein [Spirochaetia bacterium]